MPVGKRSRFRHERLRSPSYFDRRSFRTKVQRKHRVIVGCRRGYYDSKRGVCKIGTELQAILHPKGERNPCNFEYSLIEGGKSMARKTRKTRKRRRGTLKVGQSKITMRKVAGKRRRVRVTRVGKKKYRTRVVGSKRRKRRRTKRRRRK